MGFPERFSVLPEYPFARLRKLLKRRRPGGEVIDLSVGNPRHAFPGWVAETVNDGRAGLGTYPPTMGTPDLLEAIAGWVGRRYSVDVNPGKEILVLNGTREGLFNACLWLVPESKNGQVPCVLIPNPFYQVYAGGAVAAGAEPVYVPATKETGYLPDYESLPEEVLERTSIAFLCSPSNPQGAVASANYLARLLNLAERHGFRVLADECYSEIYRDEPPPGILEVAERARIKRERVVSFHSLSKRSNLPGLRSGFLVAGRRTVKWMKTLREYSAPSMPGPLQAASARAWGDETHVDENRQRYCRKFELADRILGDVKGYGSAAGGFFLWLNVGDGEAAALKLWSDSGVRVLPGEYLGREVDGSNPGQGHIRAALVADEPELETALMKIRDFMRKRGAVGS